MAGTIDPVSLTVLGNHVYKEALLFPSLNTNVHPIVVTLGTNVTPAISSGASDITVADTLLNVQGGLEASSDSGVSRRTASRTSNNEVTAGRRNRFPR